MKDRIYLAVVEMLGRKKAKPPGRDEVNHLHNSASQFILSLFTLWILALRPGVAVAEWRTFGVTDGLAGSAVRCVLEDSDGHLWFGCRGYGLSHYDGAVFTNYSMEDGLVWTDVTAIHEDISGNLWFGTNRGLCKFDGHNWTDYSTELSQKADIYVHAIAEDASGDLWFGTERGVVRYYGQGMYTITRLAGRKVYAVAVGSDGALWFGTDSGVYRLKDSSWTDFGIPGGQVGQNTRVILEDSSGGMWFGTEAGASRYDGSGWQSFNIEDGLVHPEILAIAEDRYGNIWLGTKNGVSRYDGYRFANYNTEDGLSREMVYAIVPDQTGNIWFGTHAGGVSMYDGTSFSTFEFSWGEDRGLVVYIEEDSFGNMWFAHSGGATRYDGENWTVFTTDDGLAHDYVKSVVEDSEGNIWIGTVQGLSKYDGSTWTTYTTADGLAYDYVRSALLDNRGDVWFGTEFGLSRYDGETWRTFTTSDGLPGDFIFDLFLDDEGRIWAATNNGVGLYDGSSWTSFTEPVLTACWVHTVHGDDKGNIWVGMNGTGVVKYDGNVWQSFTSADGLLADTVMDIEMDRLGNMWFGTISGVSRYDGENWGGLTKEDGIANHLVWAVKEDRSGALWFGHIQAPKPTVTRHEPDVVPPQTIISPVPPSLTTSNTVSLTFEAAFDETEGILYSHRFDGAQWSDWSPVSFWFMEGVADGTHLFEVRSIDPMGNLDATPAVFEFEIDTTPPGATIVSPAFNQVVRDTVEISGRAADLRFKNYLLEAREDDGDSWELIGESTSAVIEGPLATWDTEAFDDGAYELRLSIVDTLGMIGTDIVRVIVDNEPPWDYETAPCVVSVNKGGDVYTADGGVHLYFPPNAFDSDTEVRIQELSGPDVPDTLPDGAVRVMSGYEIGWDDTSLAKPGTLEFSHDGFEFDLGADPGVYPNETTFAIYMMGSDSQWRRLGGTIDTNANTISATLTEQGHYSVFAGGQVAGAGEALSALSITPRVFSLSGGFAAASAAIGFTLGRTGPVTVRIYNRAGRLVREVISGEQLTAGANLVHWDGRGRDGDLVEDGVYLVAVEALGREQVKPLAVVR